MKLLAIVVVLCGVLQLAAASPIAPELLEEASYSKEYGGKVMPVIDDADPDPKAQVTCETKCPEPKHVELITPEFKAPVPPEPEDAEDDDGEYMTPELKTAPSKEQDSCAPECPDVPEPVVKNGVRIVSKDQIGEDQNIAIEPEESSASGHSAEQGGIGEETEEAVDNAAETGEGTTVVTITSTQIGPASSVEADGSAAKEAAEEAATEDTANALVEKMSNMKRRRRRHRRN